MHVIQIISGGQTGADQGGLAAGQALGLKTGGWMPKGFRTQAGDRPDLADEYGVVEHTSHAYPPRTKANVKAADATIIFGNPNSSGCRLTIKYCLELNKPFYIVFWNPKDGFGDYSDFPDWLTEHQPKVLNVAGNREESQPGIYVACREFLVFALTK